MEGSGKVQALLHEVNKSVSQLRWKIQSQSGDSNTAVRELKSELEQLGSGK